MLRTTQPAERALTRRELGGYAMIRVRTWIGGTRGRPQDWTEPRNWFPAGVPDYHDTVVVGGYSRHKCHIAEDTDAVMSVHVLAKAQLRVATQGCLRIDGLFSDPYGLVCGSGLINEGNLEIDGAMVLRNVTGGGIDNRGLLCNRGSITTCDKVTRCDVAWGRFLNLGKRHFA